MITNLNLAYPEFPGDLLIRLRLVTPTFLKIHPGDANGVLGNEPLHLFIPLELGRSRCYEVEAILVMLNKISDFNWQNS